MMASNKHTLMSAIMVGLALWVTGCGGSGSSNASAPRPQPQPVSPVENTPANLDLQVLLNQAVENGVTGMTLLVDSPQLSFTGSAGLSNKETLEPMTVDAVMPTGSAGKSFTAILALQLQQEGLLDLDAPISNWLEQDLLSQIPYSELMTLRQLLNHTSGLFEYLHNPQFGLDLIGTPDTLRLDQQVIQYALNQPANFIPGQGFSYSNSGYVLAGLILDKVLGYHHSIAVRQRILDPVGMTNTFYLGAEQGDIISGYRALSDLDLSDDESIQDTKPFLYNLGVADAPVASNVQDYLLYHKALLTSGTLLGSEASEQLIGENFLVNAGQNYHLNNSTLHYGLGWFKEASPEITLAHHNGDQFGWLTYNILWREKDMSIIMMVNCAGDLCEQESEKVLSEILKQ